MKDNVAVVVPVYKAQLSELEEVSLRQLQRVLGRYPRFFMAPQALDFDYGTLGEGFCVERFPDTFFHNTTGYSCLMLSQGFYEQFASYEYVLIYQLDAFVFSDQLEAFCRLGYDYIGAPISRSVPLWHALGIQVGNGGLSLRRTASCLRMLREHGEAFLTGNHPYKDPFIACEDAFWGFCGTQPAFEFRVPDVKTALSFAVQEDVQHAYRRMRNGWRPFGCHGWGKSHGEFWQSVFAAEGYHFSKPLPSGAMFSESHKRMLAGANEQLPLARLYGLLRRGKGAAALHLLASWLEQYSQEDAVWQRKTEDATYLWRLARFSLGAEDPVRELVEQALEEVVRRTLLAGDFRSNDASLAAEILRPYMRRDEESAERLAAVTYQAKQAAWEQKRPAQPLPAVHHRGCKVVAITMVKNEMDVIESFVRHTLDFADEILVADHQSSDRTPEILAALAAEGCPVRIERLEEASYQQSEVMTQLMERAARECGADVILPLDADEFLMPLGNTSCRSLLEQFPCGEARSLHWRDYAPAEPEVHEGAFLLSQPLICQSEYHRGQKVIVGGELVRTAAVRLMQGNHGIEILMDENWQKQTVPFVSGMETAHFPWRSEAQTRSKFAVAWPNIVAKYTRNTLSASTYRASFEAVRSGNPMAFDYGGNDWVALDVRSVIPQPQLRYAEHTKPHVLANALAASEQLAETLAEARAEEKKRRVTTIVTYLGEMEPFLQTLASARAEHYPLREIVVLALGISLPEKVRSALADPCTVLLEGARAFDGLAAAVHGDYVEWLLPGETVQPGKLRRMTACFAAHEKEYPFALLFSDAPADAETDGALGMHFGVSLQENLRGSSVRGIWQECLMRGQSPAGGLSGVLMTRQLLADAGWLARAFQAGWAHRLWIWKELLSAGSRQRLPYFGILWEQMGRSASASLADRARNQLDWQRILLEDDTLSAEERALVVDRQRRTGIALLEQAMREGENMTAPVWQEYQRMCMQL